MNSNDHLVEQIAALIENAKQHVVTVVNSTMIVTYYEIGRMIVEGCVAGGVWKERLKGTLEKSYESLWQRILGR